MGKKEKDVFSEIGDKFKELGEELKPHLMLAAMEREPNMAMVAPGRKSKMQNSALATILKANCSLIFL